MKTIGVRALRENPGVLSRYATDGEFVLITHRNNPLSLALPFDDELIRADIHVTLAVKLHEEGVLTLAKAAKLAKTSIEGFLQKLASLGIVVVDQNIEELNTDLSNLND